MITGDEGRFSGVSPSFRVEVETEDDVGAELGVDLARAFSDFTEPVEVFLGMPLDRLPACLWEGVGWVGGFGLGDADAREIGFGQVGEVFGAFLGRRFGRGADGENGGAECLEAWQEEAAD